MASLLGCLGTSWLKIHKAQNNARPWGGLEMACSVVLLVLFRGKQYSLLLTAAAVKIL